MRTFPVLRTVWRGLAGRRLQAVVIGLVVLAAGGASVLAAGMLADTNVPFDHAFSADSGAHAVVTMRAAKVSPAQLAATTRLPGVTASAGPFPEASLSTAFTTTGANGSLQGQQLELTGRSSPGGPVDRLILTAGSWPTTTGQIVLGSQDGIIHVEVGQRITLTGIKGKPVLTISGIATSVTNTAQAWVLPAEIAALGGPQQQQMLYRFADAGTDAAVAHDIAAVSAALPAGAVAASQSYLSARALASATTAPWVPFIVAFGVITLVLSVLIVVNVVSGAVVAGTQRIGVLKSIGFSPFQVVMTYVLQVAIPALVGCALGAVLGNLLSTPLLKQNAQVYGTGSLSVPLWVEVVVPLVLLALTCVAGLLPALRAGRMSAMQAIATGRAPKSAHGFFAHRLLGRMRRLPRPLTLGLATPFARPTRTLITLVAVFFGTVAVTFGIGLSTSVSRTANALSLAPTVPVQVRLAGNPTGPHHGQFSVHGRPVALSGEGAAPAQQRTLTTLLTAQPGTQHYVPETDDRISVAGLAAPLSVYSYDGDSSWVGFGVINGRWYSGIGEADVNTYFLTATGAKVGGTYTLTSAGRQETVRIVGEVFLPGATADMMMSSATLALIAPGQLPQQYDVEVSPGTNVQSYANGLSAAIASSSLGSTAGVTLATANSPIFTGVLALVYLLSAILMVVAALGVLNTVVLQVRERVHDLGIYKAIGMSPAQMIAMVICSVTGIGLAAGVIAIPASVALHQFIVPIMGHAAQSNLPLSILSVYQPWELVLLGLSGVLIAVAGALAPGGWAARSRTITALRAE